MASKRRLRRRCQNKLRYSTKEKARLAAFFQARRTARFQPIHAYRCPLGDHWHVGRFTPFKKAA